MLLVGVAWFAPGCRRDEITVYTVPKEKAAPPTASRRSRPQPMFSWVLPADWRQVAAGTMNVARFAVTGPGGEEAEVTITPLMKLGGRDTEIVNMWRDTLGLEPLSREEIESQFQSVTVAGETGRLFQIEGSLKSTNQPPRASRIITAVVHRSDASWFYKLSGDAGLVGDQKPAFIDFLRTLRVQESSESEHADTRPKLNWQMPAHWKELPAGDMQLAKFTVPARGGAKAEVSVSRFPNDAGGTLANVNRWRGQLGLGEVQETELAAIVSALDPANPDARLVDLKHENRRLVAAIVPRAGNYWFYKLLGDAEAVAPERDAFIRFAQSAP